MATKSTRQKVKQEKTNQVAAQKKEHCRVICVGSFTSTLHVVLPMLKVLNRLGTVQVFSEDRSLLLLSPKTEEEFTLGNVKVEVVESVSLVEEIKVKNFHYTVLIVNEFLPIMDIDKYIFLSGRHNFRKQLKTGDSRYVPVVSVLNPAGLDPKVLQKEKTTVFVNEAVIQAPNYANCEVYLNPVLHGLKPTNVRVNVGIIRFLVDVFAGIDNCIKVHIQKILMERGVWF